MDPEFHCWYCVWPCSQKTTGLWARACGRARWLIWRWGFTCWCVWRRERPTETLWKSSVTFRASKNQMVRDENLFNEKDLEKLTWFYTHPYFFNNIELLSNLVVFFRAHRRFQVLPFVQHSSADLPGQAGPPRGLWHCGLHADEEDDSRLRHAADAVKQTGGTEPLVEGEGSLSPWVVMKIWHHLRSFSSGCSLGFWVSIRAPSPLDSLSAGYYPGLSAPPGSMSLVVPCGLGEVELALAMEMSISLNASAILSTAETTDCSLTITLRRYPAPPRASPGSSTSCFITLPFPPSFFFFLLLLQDSKRGEWVPLSRQPPPVRVLHSAAQTCGSVQSSEPVQGAGVRRVPLLRSVLAPPQSPVGSWSVGKLSRASTGFHHVAQTYCKDVVSLLDLASRVQFKKRNTCRD